MNNTTLQNTHQKPNIKHKKTDFLKKIDRKKLTLKILRELSEIKILLRSSLD